MNNYDIARLKIKLLTSLIILMRTLYAQETIPQNEIDSIYLVEREKPFFFQGTVYFYFSNINASIEDLKIFSLTGKLVWGKQNQIKKR